MNIWNFVSGYGNICIMGRYPEGLVNKAVSVGIPVSDIMVMADGSVRCSMSFKGIRRLHGLASGSGCRIRILKKRGVPCILKSIRMDIGLFILALAASAAVFAALSRIWIINIDSGEVSPSLIASALEEAGICRGMKAGGLSPSDVSAALSSVSGVAKAEVLRKGIVLTVKITGNDASYPLQNSDTESLALGVYASKDCIITDLTVISGKALVNIGDAVSKGQMLITGDLGELKEGYTVPAVGEAYGQILYRSTAEAPMNVKAFKRSGESTVTVSLVLFGSEYHLGIPFDRYELEPIGSAFANSCFLPVMLRKSLCYRLIEADSEIDLQAARERAETIALQRLYASVPKEGKIISVSTEYSQGNDGAAVVTAYATVIEKISCGRN